MMEKTNQTVPSFKVNQFGWTPGCSAYGIAKLEELGLVEFPAEFDLFDPAMVGTDYDDAAAQRMVRLFEAADAVMPGEEQKCQLAAYECVGELVGQLTVVICRTLPVL